MNKASIIENSSDHLIRTIVACVKQATDDDIKRYIAEFRPGTTNGIPHQIHDWINGHLRDHIDSDRVYTMEIKRSSWKGRLIIDEANKVVYSIMRIDRLNTLRKEKRDRPHYLQSIVGVLNAELEASNKQMSLYEYENSMFSTEEIFDDYNRIFGNKISPSDGYKHCLVLFATRKTELYDIRLCVVDKDLDVVEDKSLIELIRPDYAALTGVEVIEDKDNDVDKAEYDAQNTSMNIPLVKLKDISKLSND